MLHVVTPLVYSASLSSIAGHDIWLKMETEQLSRSFKPRGVGRSIWATVQRKGKDVHIIIASGGNAGLAAAVSCHTLGVKCSVHVHAKTESLIQDKMRSYGANVVVSDGGWEVVNARATTMAEEDPMGVYVHPFEGADLVRGHASIIDEIYDQLPKVSAARGTAVHRPDAVVSAVGGGGMVRGIMLGLSEHVKARNEEPAHVVGVTTFGSDSWGRSVEQADEGVVEIDDFSRAKSLSCKKCSYNSVRDARIYASTGTYDEDAESTGRVAGDGVRRYLSTVRIDDSRAGAAAWKATYDLGHLIELSCGAAVAVAYEPAILRRIAEAKGLPGRMNVVIILCGGSRVGLRDIEEYRDTYGNGYGDILVDGEKVE